MSGDLCLDPFTVDPDFNGPFTFYFPAKAEAVGASIAEIGQQDRIKVRREKAGAKFAWKRVTGLHRLQGCIAIGRDVRAEEWQGSDEELIAIRISENLDRRDLEPLERSALIAGMAEDARRKIMNWQGVDSQQALAGKARQNKLQYSESEKSDELAEQRWTNLSTAYGWKQEVADAWGVGPKDIQRATRIHRLIIEPFPELIDAFKDHPVAKVADSLLKIAAIKDEAKRRKVIEVLLAGPKDLGFALQSAGVADVKVAPEPYQKFASQILGGWSRLGTGEKRKFIPELVSAIPPGMRTLVRAELDRLDAETNPSTGSGRTAVGALTHYQDLAAEAAGTSTGSVLSGEEI
jgi:ParB family transcriptional regulator, chromosome partitioning protein